MRRDYGFVRNLAYAVENGVYPDSGEMMTSDDRRVDRPQKPRGWWVYLWASPDYEEPFDDEVEEMIRKM